jgi:hypothetical protein
MHGWHGHLGVDTSQKLRHASHLCTTWLSIRLSVHHMYSSSGTHLHFSSAVPSHEDGKHKQAIHRGDFG